LALDEPKEDDEIVHVEGFSFAYSKSDRDLLNQTTIDYKDFWFGEGFAVCSPVSEPC
jgi:Fe-S cluster assembly iron-binding protein IscA